MWSPQFSTFGSIVNVGAMFGAIASGRIADYLGRRKVSISSNLPTPFFVLVEVTAASVW